MVKIRIYKLLVLILITLITLIFLKTSITFKHLVYKYVYTENLSFASINKWYTSKFGNPLPFSYLLEENMPVFNEKLIYNGIEKYKDGVILDVSHDYMIPALDNGIVIFVGEKEGYGNTIIVQQENGIDVWYSNVCEANVKLYDYIKSGELIGNANDLLYLVFIKNGEVVNYEDYI